VNSRIDKQLLFKFRPKSYRRGRRIAGIGAIINSAISAAEFQQMTMGYTELRIQNREILALFENPLSKNPRSYKKNLGKLMKKVGYVDQNNAHIECDRKILIEKKFAFESIFKMKNLEHFDSLANRFVSTKTLGIQVRGTDKHHEIRPVRLERLFKVVNEFIEKYEIENIFLATDDYYYYEELSQKFGNIVTRNLEHSISMNRKPLHLNLRRTQINREMLEDVYVLSKCPYFLYSFSNVSHLALIMGSSDFIGIKCLNN
jgi:hypothetical protein